MKILHRIRDGLMAVIGIAAILLLGIMTMVGTWQILSRYAFGKPSTVSKIARFTIAVLFRKRMQR